jgi:hypothetical protein
MVMMMLLLLMIVMMIIIIIIINVQWHWVYFPGVQRQGREADLITFI